MPGLPSRQAPRHFGIVTPPLVPRCRRLPRFRSGSVWVESPSRPSCPTHWEFLKYRIRAPRGLSYTEGWKQHRHVRGWRACDRQTPSRAAKAPSHVPDRPHCGPRWVPLSGTLPAPGPLLCPPLPTPTLLPMLVPFPRLMALPCWGMQASVAPPWSNPACPAGGGQGHLCLLCWQPHPTRSLCSVRAGPGGAHIQFPGASLVHNCVTLSKGPPCAHCVPAVCHLRDTLRSTPAPGDSLTV